MRYFGSTAWHSDSSYPLSSMGFLAYLDALDGATGALRVSPGSHRDRSMARQAVVLETRPGDVILLDEHLFHSSEGGDERLQWRVDYVLDPTTPGAEETVRSYLASIFPADWDGGYDVDANPSYEDHWLESGRRCVARLRHLGAVDLARAQEANMRGARRGPTG
jgi:hypothetical protein